MSSPLREPFPRVILDSYFAAIPQLDSGMVPISDHILSMNGVNDAIYFDVCFVIQACDKEMSQDTFHHDRNHEQLKQS